MGRNYWRRPDALDAPLTATTQAEIDAYTYRNVPFLILGGEPDYPLLVKHPCKIPPAIGNGANVTVLPASLSHPSAVCVVGEGARVSGFRNARIICLNESWVTACDICKVWMYAGILIARDNVRATLYAKAVAHLYGHCKAVCRNDSEAYCYEDSNVRLCHQATVHMCDETAHLWIRDYRGGTVGLPYRKSLLNI